MGNHQSLRILLRDTCRFIQSSFAVIARAAMHTYIFALPFTPFETDLYRRYVDTSGPHAVRVIRGEEADWDPCVQVVKFSNPIKSVAVSGDGIHVAVACGKSIYLLDASTRVLIVTLEGHVEDVESIVFSTDSTRVASSAGDATIRIWNCLTGQQLQSLPGAKKRPYVVSKLDGSLLVVYRYSSAVFYDWLTGEAQEVLDKGDDVCSIAISSDGSRVAVASQHSVMTWTPKVKKRVLVKYDRPEEASVVFSSDADCLVSGYGPFIKFWDVDTGRLQKTFKMENGREVRLLAYSSDGRSLASVSSTGVVDIWDPTRGTITRTFKHDCWLMSVAFSANDAFLFSHNNAGALVTWDCGSTSQPNLESVPHNGPIEFMAISGDGATAISTADGTAIAWHTQSGKQLFKLVGHTYNTKAIAISQDGAYIVTGGDKKLRLWDKTGLELKVMKKKNMGSITAVAFLPNSHRVISGHEDECLIIWECRSGAKVKTLRLEKESGAITCIKFLNNGARMMTHSGGSGLTWLWNSSTWKQLYQLEYRGDPALDISLDGSLIAWATENFLRVYDSNTGNERFATPLGVTINGRLRPVQRIAFVHDCRFVVTQFEQGITLVWNAVTGERMSPPNPSLYPVAGRQKILKSTSRCCILSEGWFYEVDTDGQCIPICCLPTSMTVTSTCFHEDTCIIGTRSGGVVIICLPQYSEEAEL
jgi:WD40 repeat protein